MGVSLKEISAWTYCGIHAAAFLLHVVLNAPLPPKGSTAKYASPKFFFAYQSVGLGLLSAVIHFLALAFDIGLHERTDGIVPWIRYLGAGTQILFFVLAFTFIAAGGAAYVWQGFWLSLLAGAIFAGIAPVNAEDGRGLFILGGVIYVVLCVTLHLHDLSRRRIPFMWRASMAGGLLMYVALAGLELQAPKLISNTLFSWVFGGFLTAFTGFILALYFFFVETTLPKSVILGE